MISLTFDNLDNSMAQALLTAWAEIERAVTPVAQPAQPPAQPVAQPAQPPAQPVAQPAQPPAQPVAQPAQPPAQPVAQPAQPPAQPVAQPAQPPAQPVAQPAQPPAQPVAQPAQPHTTAPIDALGVPYNPDIHGSIDGKSGGKTQDGVWRIKRGVNKALYNQWRDEHTASPCNRQPATFGDQQQQQPATFGDQQQQQQQPATFGDQQPASLEDPGQDALMAKAALLDAAGVLTWERTNDIMQKCGTTDNTEVVTNPEYRKIAWRELLLLEAA